MWAVANRTPYAVERSWVQDKDANKIWLVAVKATFDVVPDGSTRLAKKQLPVLRVAEHVGDAGTSSLKYEADLVGVKTATDILVNGSAWVSGGTRASQVDVYMAVGSVEKHLRIFGDRVWDRNVLGGLTLSRPEPFESLPIQYERAYGGWDRASSSPSEHRLDARNPIGTGFATDPEHCVGHLAPNVEYPHQLIRSWKDRPMPAGLNAIECHWSPRREFAGTYDERWQRNRFPLWAEDFDSRYNQCAPGDQQANGFLRGGERVELINLSPGGRLCFQLPRVYPFFQTRFGRKRVEHRAQLSTVILEPDIPRVIITWQTSIKCNTHVDDLDSTIVTEKRAI